MVVKSKHTHDELAPERLWVEISVAKRVRTIIFSAHEDQCSDDDISYIRERKPESPILAFQKWAEGYCGAARRKLTPDEYFLAQAAFYAAHPGEVPASVMEQPRKTTTS